MPVPCKEVCVLFLSHRTGVSCTRSWVHPCLRLFFQKHGDNNNTYPVEVVVTIGKILKQSLHDRKYSGGVSSCDILCFLLPEDSVSPLWQSLLVAYPVLSLPSSSLLESFLSRTPVRLVKDIEGPRVTCGQRSSRDSRAANGMWAQPLARAAEARCRGWTQLCVFSGLRLLSSTGVARENMGFVLKNYSLSIWNPDLTGCLATLHPSGLECGHCVWRSGDCLEATRHKLRVAIGKVEGTWTTDVIVGPLQQPGLIGVAVRCPWVQALPNALPWAQNLSPVPTWFLYPFPLGILDLVVMIAFRLRPHKNYIFLLTSHFFYRRNTM